MRRTPDPVYEEAKRLYSAGRSAIGGLHIDVSSGMAWIVDENGRGLRLFVSRGAAEKHREVAMRKARKACLGEGR